MGLWTPYSIWGAAWKRVWSHPTLSGALARMPQIPCNAHFLNFLFKGLIWIMCASLPQGFFSCNVLQTRLNVCSEGSSQDPFMGVLCMVMLSAVTSVNSEPPDTMFVSKKDDTISGWVFLVLLRDTAVQIPSALVIEPDPEDREHVWEGLSGGSPPCPRVPTSWSVQSHLNLTIILVSEWKGTSRRGLVPAAVMSDQADPESCKRF